MKDEKEFIKQSNNIEGVTEEQAHEESIAAFNWIRTKPQLNHERVKELHDRVMSRRQPEIAGEYRDCHVRVGTYSAPPPEDVEGLMTELLMSRHPQTMVDAVAWHVFFEKIHPFADGNGRVGRLLYLWHCDNLMMDPILWQNDDKQSNYYRLFQEGKEGGRGVEQFQPRR